MFSAPLDPVFLSLAHEDQESQDVVVLRGGKQRPPGNGTLEPHVQGVPRSSHGSVCSKHPLHLVNLELEQFGDVPNHLSGVELGEIHVAFPCRCRGTAGSLCVGSSGFPNPALQGLEFPIFPREIHFLGHFLIIWGLLGTFLSVADLQGGTKPWRIPLDSLFAWSMFL